MIKKSETAKEKMREWYKKNREHHIAKVQERQKETGYSSEKTDKQRKLRYVKRRTRLLHPLDGKRCEFCILPAIEHHHTTIPPKINEFVFACHDCHMEKDLEMENHSKLQSTKLTMEVK